MGGVEWLGITEGHQQYHHSTECMQHLICLNTGTNYASILYCF